MTPKERLFRQARGQEVDRIPCIGGWMGGVANLARIGGLSVEQYLANPFAGVVQANKALGVDAMVMPVIPERLDQIRTGAVQESNYHGIEPEALKRDADLIPDSEKAVLATFDRAKEELQFRQSFESMRTTWQGIQFIPTYWDIGGHFALYHYYGYTAFLEACALYPETVGKIWWSKSLRSRERAKILIPLYKEYDLVPLLFCGEDLCNNQGPMVSPVFLRKHYLPNVKMSIEPLVDAGIRLIHHCDGDVRPLVRDYLGLGFSGLQGFQYELGVDPFELKALRGPSGEELLFFMGLSVTRTLPFGTVEDVRAEVDYFVDVTDGGRGMFLFTSNVTGVEVPPENLQAAYAHVKTCKVGRKPSSPHPRWPWSMTHA